MPRLPGFEANELFTPMSPEPPDNAFLLPCDPAFHLERVVHVRNADEMNELVDLAFQRPIAWVGVAVRSTQMSADPLDPSAMTDPTGMTPLGMSLALAESRREGGVLYRAALDLRTPDVLEGLRRILRLQVPFVGYRLTRALLAFHRLELPEPSKLWDLWVCERAFGLGRLHKNYDVQQGMPMGISSR